MKTNDMNTEAEHPDADKPAIDAALSAQNVSRQLSRSKLDLATLERNVDHYPEAIKAPVHWLQSFWLGHCRGNGSTLRVIGEKLGFDKSDEYYNNLLKGYYFRSPTTTWQDGGKAWSEFLEFFEAVKRYALQAERSGKLPFIVTPTYRCFEAHINTARALNAVCKVVALTGPTGSQKTACERHYAQLNNHSQVSLFQAPKTARIGVLQHKIADCYHVVQTRLNRIADRESAIRANLNETRTLIIDNAQRLYIDGKGSDQPCFDYLLELQEDTGCTLVLSFTTDFTDVLTAGRAKGYFEQFVGRFGGFQNILRFPDYTPAADLRVIARHFGLDAGKGAMEYLHKWSREAGRIRIVFHRLQVAQAFAKAEDRTRITLADLQSADEYAPTAIGSDEEDEA